MSKRILRKLVMLATILVVFGALEACRKGDEVLSQEERGRGPTRQVDNPGPAPSQTWTAVVHSTGKPNQQFHIRESGAAPTMTSVEVYAPDGDIELWEQVESLDEAGPDDQVFALEVLFDGTALIRFGDGEHGAIPPARDRGIRVRSVGGGGMADGVIAVETGVRRLGELEARWLRETVGDGTAKTLLDQARARTYHIVTCKLAADGSATITKWEVPGSALAPFLREIGGESKKVGEVLSVEAVDIVPPDRDE